MVFPYVEKDTLQRRLEIGPDELGMSDDDWLQILGEVLGSASELVESEEYAGVFYRTEDSIDDIPHTIKEAVIRLSRARLLEIRIDGLNSESTGDNASYNYRSPAEIRAEVRSELQSADVGDDDSGPDDIRSVMI